jgi:hypothetical protein
MVVLRAAASVFGASVGVLAIFLIVDGIVHVNVMPVVFGAVLAVILGFINWDAHHLASRLEFSDGYLSWWGSLPWSVRTRPGRVSAIRWPIPSRRRLVQIELDGGRKVSVVPRRGLMEFINSVHDVQPTVIVDIRPDSRGAGG